MFVYAWKAPCIYFGHPSPLSVRLSPPSIHPRPLHPLPVTCCNIVFHLCIIYSLRAEGMHRGGWDRVLLVHKRKAEIKSQTGRKLDDWGPDIDADVWLNWLSQSSDLIAHNVRAQDPITELISNADLWVLINMERKLMCVYLYVINLQYCWLLQFWESMGSMRQWRCWLDEYFTMTSVYSTC